MQKMARIEIDKDEGDTTSLNAEEDAWGTLEELLLVCAVNRYGTKSWDFIAKEVRKRSFKTRNNANSFLNALTPQNCKRKYRDLRRRFSVNRGGGDDSVTVVDGYGGAGGGEGENVDDKEDDVRDELLCMVDELRKLRVEELKREVQRLDVSIESLQLKVKILEEEGDRSLKAGAEGAADLTTGTNDKRRELERSPLEKADGETASGGRPDEADDRSFNESNSTNHKGESRRVAEAGENRDSKREPVENRCGEPERVGAQVNFEPAKSSFTGGSGMLGDGVDDRAVELEASQLNRLSEPVELKESVSDSKRDVKETTKHSSDVQSSASLSRRKRRCWLAGDGGSSGDELGADEQSPANKRITMKSQPLIRFMEILRSHKHGLAFERRLPSQKTEKYQNLIRQHMDLEKVQSKLDNGIYCGSHLKFYRDLLLVFTNAILFYPKSSAEHLAARELRKVVTEEIGQRTQKPKPVPLKHDRQPHLLEPFVKKPRSATTMIVCRRHSSTSVKQPSSESMNKKDEGERVENGRELEEKPKPELKRAPSRTNSNNISNGHATKGDQKRVQKKLKRERSALGNRSLETSKYNNNNKKKKKKKNKEDGSDNSDEEEFAIRKKEKQEKAMLATKKQGVVNFLKRMKQNSPAREGEAANGGEGEEDEKRKKGKDGRKRGKKTENGREYEVLRRTSGRREGRDVKREIDKRAVGRPPRRKAAMSMTEVVAVKKKREGAEKEAGGSGRPKKKSRR